MPPPLRRKGEGAGRIRFEIAGLDTKPLVGHLAAWSYFESVNTPENKEFIAKWHDYMHDNKRVTNDPMESAYILFHMWTQAVQQAGTTDVDAVRQAMIGQRVKSPSGFEVTMLPNHHMAKPVMIGEVQANGQFAIVYQSKALPPKAWSPYVEPTKARSPIGRGPGPAAAALRPNTPRSSGGAVRHFARWFSSGMPGRKAGHHVLGRFRKPKPQHSDETTQRRASAGHCRMSLAPRASIHA
jgi:Periplasmic binding protein domain